MSTITVQGISPLSGEIQIQGSKNAVLPMMAASILHKGTTVITHVPRIQDVFCMMGILEYMGCVCKLEEHTLMIDAHAITNTNIPESYVKSMRSSIMILGAVLSRTGEAITYHPGGCSIGSRPIDLHLHALRALGAEITEEEDSIKANSSKLVGTTILFYYPSVGATENALLAAVMAEGITQIEGAAREPEIEELCYFLNNMGARISGIGTSQLIVKGVKQLKDSVFRVSGDRIVAGTYLAAVAAVTGKVTLSGVNPKQMQTVIREFINMGMEMEWNEHQIKITALNRPKKIKIKTEPYPGFPTDLQSPMMGVLCMAEGCSQIEETVFEGRYKTAKELHKLGADIIIEDTCAWIYGGNALKGAHVVAQDLRGGAALVVAGLAAEGITCISECGHIMRGYEDICQDLSLIGADIRRSYDKVYSKT